MRIDGKTIYLKLLTREDVDPNYVRWMNDPEITRFLESRWRAYTLADLQAYVAQVNDGRTNFMFGIYDRKTEEHIGNIKLADISQLHRYGDIGIIIGEKDYWGKGIAGEAIRLLCAYAFNHLNLHKVTAGIYETNVGSYKAFLKCGFSQCGRYQKHVFCEGAYVDMYKVELLRETFEEERSHEA